VRNLSDCFLYGILDLAYVAREHCLKVANQMIEGGVDMIQLRGKHAAIDDLAELAARLHAITAPASVPLVVNDYPEIARRVPVEGVHVGQDDQSISSVRTAVERPIWVGKSTHSVAQAVAALTEGADYIGFGPLYATLTKPSYVPIGLDQIDQVHQEVDIPIFCIGGVKLQNLPEVIGAGAKRAVIVSGILQAADVTEYARACRGLLSTATPLAARAIVTS
jgi:thiamine-phosphate pyrophosphorylase